VVSSRPKNTKGWIALIEALMAMEDWEKAEESGLMAYIQTNKKNIFLFKLVAIHFSAGKIKEALIQLENAMQLDARMYKKLVEWCPQILQHPGAMTIIARFRKKRL
jgi:protein involved in temperature-dependent protein secretion